MSYGKGLVEHGAIGGKIESAQIGPTDSSDKGDQRGGVYLKHFSGKFRAAQAGQKHVHQNEGDLLLVFRPKTNRGIGRTGLEQVAIALPQRECNSSPHTWIVIDKKDGFTPAFLKKWHHIVNIGALPEDFNLV